MRRCTASLWVFVSCLAVAGAAGAQQVEPRDARTGAASDEPAAQKARAPQPPAKPAKPPAPSPAAMLRRQPGRPGSFEVSGGVAWLGPGSLGSSDANLTGNGSTTPYRYFTTSGDMAGAPALDARLAYNLARRLALEAGFSYSKPQIRFSVSGDSEGVTGLTASGEKASQYFADANVLFFLPRLSFARGRGRTFVEGGGGYLRQLHAGNFNVDTGSVFNGGAGIKYYLKPRARGLLKAFGIRVDLRTYYKANGYTFDGRNTWTAGLAAGAIAAF